MSRAEPSEPTPELGLDDPCSLAPAYPRIRFLNPEDATHLAQAGHDAVAEAVVDLGFSPLVAGP